MGERGVQNVEFNQGVTKSGIISRLALAEVLVAAASSTGAGGKTFEVYYRDTAKPVSLDEVLKQPLQGTLFASGAEVQGNSYSDMFDKLKTDQDYGFDLNSLGSDSIM